MLHLVNIKIVLKITTHVTKGTVLTAVDRNICSLLFIVNVIKIFL